LLWPPFTSPLIPWLSGLGVPVSAPFPDFFFNRDSSKQSSLFPQSAETRGYCKVAIGHPQNPLFPNLIVAAFPRTSVPSRSRFWPRCVARCRFSCPSPPWTPHFFWQGNSRFRLPLIFFVSFPSPSPWDSPSKPLRDKGVTVLRRANNPIPYSPFFLGGTQHTFFLSLVFISLVYSVSNANRFAFFFFSTSVIAPSQGGGFFSLVASCNTCLFGSRFFPSFFFFFLFPFTSPSFSRIPFEHFFSFFVPVDPVVNGSCWNRLHIHRSGLFLSSFSSAGTSLRLVFYFVETAPFLDYSPFSSPFVVLTSNLGLPRMTFFFFLVGVSVRLTFPPTPVKVGVPFPPPPRPCRGTGSAPSPQFLGFHGFSRAPLTPLPPPG